MIIPAYQAARTLGVCLEAIASSVFRPARVIVVDDGGSTDGTADVARSHGAEVLSLSRRLGPGGARNAGVAAAGGDILVFVDADVAVRPGAIGLLVAALRENPDVDAAFGSYDDRPYESNVTSQYKNLLHHFVHQQGREEAETFWAGLGAVRRKAFEALGGFDAEKYTRPSIEDIEFGHRLRVSGRRIRLVKSAQGSHLKRWDPFGVFRTDLFQRALPWTQLILGAGRMPTDLNLGMRHRLGVAATAVLVGALFGAGVDPRFWYLAAAALLVVLAAGSDVFRFFIRQRGVLFTLLALPLHVAYYVASGLGFALGLGRHAASGSALPLPDARRIFGNAFSLGVGEIVARAFSFFATIHLARVLAADGFGRVEFAATLALYISTLSTFGLDTVGTLRVAVDPGHTGAHARTIISLRLLLATFGTLILLLLSFAIPRLAEMRALLLLSTLVVFAESLSVSWAYQGLERMRRVAAVGILGQAVYCAGVFLFVHSRSDILRVPVLSAVGAATAAAVLAVVAYRTSRRLPTERVPGLTRSLVGEAAPLALITVAGMVNYNANVVILSFFGDDRHIGLFRAAARTVGVFQMLGLAFSAAAFPNLARQAAVREKFRRTLDWTIRVSAAGWICVAALLFATAPVVLRLTFGRGYDESVPALRLLVLAAAIVGVRAQYRSALIALRRTGRNLPPALWAAGTSVVLNLVLIPTIGLVGIALAAIASEGVMLVLIRREVIAALRQPAA